MQTVLVRIAVALWPRIEPVILGAAKTLVVQAIESAKAQTLPARYAFLQPVLVEIETDLIDAINRFGNA